MLSMKVSTTKRGLGLMRGSPHCKRKRLMDTPAILGMVNST